MAIEDIKVGEKPRARRVDVDDKNQSLIATATAFHPPR